MKHFLSTLLFVICYLLFSGSPALAANSGNFTMSLWVNPTTSVASKALIGKAEEFRVFTNASGQPGCQIKTTTWQTAAVSSQQLAVSSWAHVICTYDLVNLKIYVNGVLKGTQALTSLPDDTAAVLRIGQDDSASTTYTNLAGTIDEFRFYNYALTSDEILTEYNHASALALGNLGTSSTSPFPPSNSASASFCIPGDSATCSAPVADWEFEEGSGTSVADTSGNGNTGTWYGGGTHWGPGKQGKAGTFNGGNDYVDAGNNSVVQLSTGTVEAWIKTSGSTGDGQYSAIVTKRLAYGMFLKSNVFMIYDWGASADRSSGVNLADNRWHHIVVSFQSGVANGTVLYIDGITKLTTTMTVSAQSVNLEIGRGGAETQFFTGSIDQVRIFNYARTAAQIAWDYNRGGPVGWWKMNECTGTAIHDSSGNNNTGTLTNATAGTCDDGTSTTAWGGGKTGKYGSSLKFDGVDDYVSVADNSLLDGSSIMTLSAWVKASSYAGNKDIISKAISTTTSDYRQFAFGIDSNKIYWLQSQDGSVWQTSVESTTPSINVWHNLVGVNNGTVARFYIDGVEVGTADTNPAASLAASSLPMYFAWLKTQNFNNYFSGQIDDVRIFNYALTATQVKTLFNENAAVRFGP